MTDGGGFIGANVCPTDQATVLLSAKDKLISDLSTVFESNQVIISNTRIPSVEVHDNLYLSVAPGADSQFDPEGVIGGGNQWIAEHASLDITVFSRLQTDQIEQSELMLTDSARGLLYLKKLVLKSMAGQQLYDGSGNPLLISYMRPIRSLHPPNEEHDDGWGSTSLSFIAPFVWNLF